MNRGFETFNKNFKEQELNIEEMKNHSNSINQYLKISGYLNKENENKVDFNKNDIREVAALVYNLVTRLAENSGEYSCKSSMNFTNHILLNQQLQKLFAKSKPQHAGVASNNAFSSNVSANIRRNRRNGD